MFRRSDPHKRGPSEPFAFHSRTGVIVESKIWKLAGGKLVDVIRTSDGMWQFLGEEDPNIGLPIESDAMMVTLSKVLKRWPVVEQLSGLRPGHCASWRDGHGWVVEELHEENDSDL